MADGVVLATLQNTLQEDSFTRRYPVRASLEVDPFPPCVSATPCSRKTQSRYRLSTTLRLLLTERSEALRQYGCKWKHGKPGGCTFRVLRRGNIRLNVNALNYHRFRFRRFLTLRSTAAAHDRKVDIHSLVRQ
jgi:hypothetical protein